MRVVDQPHRTLGNWVALDRQAQEGTSGLSSVARSIADRGRVAGARGVHLPDPRVSGSWFYRWRDRGPTKRRRRRAKLDAAVLKEFDTPRGLHGSPRLHADRREKGWKVRE